MDNSTIDIFKDNDLVITENCYKLDILKKISGNKKLLNIKFMTSKEFLSKYYFAYDEKAVYYLIQKHNINESIARLYLENLYFVDNRKYNNQKLDKLVQIKEELIKENLLVFDKLFLNYIKDKRLVFYKYNSFTKFEFNTIEKLKTITDVLIIDKEYNKYSPKVYEFENIFDEVSFVATEILKLVEKGISPNKIKLANVNDDYKNIIDFIFTLYNIKTDISKDYLISNQIAQEFLKRTCSIEEEIERLNSKYKNSEVLNQIVKTVNKYIAFDNQDIINEMITNEFKKVTIKQKKYNNVIEAIDYKNYPIEDEYVFLLGFNQGSIPKQYKDEEYITDSLKDSLLLEKTVDKNKKEKEITINSILNIKNLTITYKNSTTSNKFYPSVLIDDLDLNVIKNYKQNDIYSKDYAKLNYAKELDKYILYGTVSDDLKSYDATFDIPYNTYNNEFKGINNDEYLDSIKDGFNLSYSTMNDYYNCAFKYYLSHVLKLNIFEDTFATYIGSLFHYVLEKGLSGQNQVKELVGDYVQSNRKLTAKEEFFVENMIPDIEFALDTIKSNMDYTDLKNLLFEKRVEVVKHDKVTVTFKGFIDKIMYEEENDETVIAIIDYKTGYTDIDLKYVPFGLSMQLPVYLYLANNIKELSNIRVGGFYIQKVLGSVPTIKIDKDIETQKKENLLLNGYSNSDKNILEKVDYTYVNSNIIKALKLKKDGEFSSYSKVLDNEEINTLIDVTDKKINEAISSICNADFSINPKVDSDKNIGCKYCQYKDICFFEKKNEVRIVPDKNLSFLGGDQNA